MNREELWGVAEIIGKLTERYNGQLADHERQLTEHRAAFGARTEADAKIIAGLRAEMQRTMDRVVTERDGLLTQVQDMREEIIRVNEAHGRTKVEHDGLLDELAVQRDAFTANVERIRRELCEGRDALRAEVAALQERLRSSIARGDFAQIEVAALKSQTPKQHPVKVGEWVKAPLGTRGKVVSLGVDYLEVELTNGPPTRWWPVYMCEPCDPPEATHAEPDLTHLHAKGTEAWSDAPNATQWVEEMRGNTEAAHDTEAGKAAAAGLLINGGLDVRKVTT